MAHLHSVYDTDAHFCIDPITRRVKEDTSLKTLLAQGDHNSERFTFELPRIVEGHDMSLCDKVEIHYLNGTNAGVYEVDDLQISPESEDVVIFSWLVSNNATQNAATLAFAVKLACTTNGKLDYSYNTLPYEKVSVGKSIDNGEVVVQEYADVLAQWKQDLIDASSGSGGGSSLPSGGTIGQYLMKQSETDGDAIWSDVDHPITYIESVINDQPKVNFRDLESGHYIITGYFEPFPNSTISISSDNSLIHVYRTDAGSHVICLDPLNAKIVFFEIMVDESNEKGFTYTRKLIPVLDLESIANKVTTIDDASTDEQYPSAKAVNNAISNIPIGTSVSYDESNQAIEFSLQTNDVSSYEAVESNIVNAMVTKFIMPDGTEVSLAGGGDTIDVDAELKEYMTMAKPAIASAIINKGGNVESADSLSDYATRISEIPTEVYPAETLPNQTNLTATGLQDTVGIKLNWLNVDASAYLILRKENTAPSTSADGTIVYNGGYATEGYIDTDVSKGIVYYYRIFPRNSKNQYQSIEDGSIAMVDYKDRTGQTLVYDLPLGSKLKFGQWNSADYFWEIVDTQDKESGYVTVCAEQNLGNRQYDAKETGNTVTARASGGNNRWAYSAIRQLLNSDADTGAWWAAQHEYDVAPSYASSTAGFLKDFTEYEKSTIIKKTNRCNLDTNDGGGSETVEDKVWLASSYAIGLEIFQPLEDDHTYEAFIDSLSRSYTSNWWLRTINGTSSASIVRYVNSSGSLLSNAANNSIAVRPFCLIPISTYVTWSDSDQAYIFVDDTVRNPSV